MRKNKTSGFTFIELLIAVMIFAIIATSIYFTLHSGVGMWSRSNTIIGENQEIRVFFQIISLDLRNSRPGFGVKPEKGEQRDLSEEEGLRIISEWKSDRMKFPSVIGSFEEDRVMSVLAKIIYEFDSKKNILTRCAATLKDGFDEERPDKEIMLENVTDVSFEYPYGEPGSNEYEWEDSWDREDTSPRGVKVKVALKTKFDEKEKIFEDIIFLPMGELEEEE